MDFAFAGGIADQATRPAQRPLELVAAALPSCAPSSSRPAVLPTIMRSKSGRPTWRGCGCRSRKTDPRRRRISRIRRRTHGSSPDASPPSDHTRSSRVVAPRGPRVRTPLAPAARQSANHRFRRRFYGESDRLEWVENCGLSCRGTRSSNPSPSSGESANSRSLEDHPAFRNGASGRSARSVTIPS